MTWDTSLYNFLRLRLKNSGDGMKYFVNLQTDGPSACSSTCSKRIDLSDAFY
jgi:hypothetical protein